jgi:hypothetical protein
MADARLEGEDAGANATTMSCSDRVQELQKIARDCKLTKSDTQALYADIASAVGQIAEAERAAVDLMHTALRK